MRLKMSNCKVTFGTTSKGKPSVIYQQYEFVKHRQYANGSTQWRCKSYQSSKCPARLTTNGDEIVSNTDLEHTHGGNKDNILARQAIAEMKEKIRVDSPSTSAVIRSVSDQLEPEVRMALPQKSYLERMLQRKRQKLQSDFGISTSELHSGDTLRVPDELKQTILYDSCLSKDRIIMLGRNELLRGMAPSKLLLTNGTFKFVPSLGLHLYTIHFELCPGLNPVAVYCLVQSKTTAVYNRIVKELMKITPSLDPKRILLGFDRAEMDAFSSAFPKAEIKGGYFHMTQDVMYKVNELGLKEDYATDDNLRIAIRCLPALAMVPKAHVAEAFSLISASMPAHEKLPQLLAYFKRTYMGCKQTPGENEDVDAGLFPIEKWNHFDTVSDEIARATNSIDGWHCGLQALLQRQNLTLWTFMKGLEKDMETNLSSLLKRISDFKTSTPNRYRYRAVTQRVQSATTHYALSDVLSYLRSIAHLSYV